MPIEKISLRKKKRKLSFPQIAEVLREFDEDVVGEGHEFEGTRLYFDDAVIRESHEFDNAVALLER